MAAIEYVGNTIVVGGAGTINVVQLELASMRIYATASTSEVDIVEISSGSHSIIHYATTNGVPPYSDELDVKGTYGRLSVNTVTGCSAYLQRA